MGVGSWVLVGIVLLGMIGAIALAIGNERKDERLSILEDDIPQSRSQLTHMRLS